MGAFGPAVILGNETGLKSAVRRQRYRTVLKVLAHAVALVLIYLVFSFALFLGLHLYGNIGLGVTALLIMAYVYVGFVRKKR